MNFSLEVVQNVNIVNFIFFWQSKKKSLKKSAAGSIKGYVKKGPHASMLRTILPPIATA